MIFKFRLTTNASTVTVTINTNLAITFSLIAEKLYKFRVEEVMIWF